jgi:hypothetical protein
MDMIFNPPVVKSVGANGQVSIGKRYAGRQVVVDELEPGVIMIRTATVIPDNERWLHEPEVAAKVQASLEWAAANPPTGKNTDKILQRMIDGK